MDITQTHLKSSGLPYPISYPHLAFFRFHLTMTPSLSTISFSLPSRLETCTLEKREPAGAHKKPQQSLGFLYIKTPLSRTKYLVNYQLLYRAVYTDNYVCSICGKHLSPSLSGCLLDVDFFVAYQIMSFTYRPLYRAVYNNIL